MPRPPAATLSLGLLLRRSHQRAALALNEALTPLGLTGRHFGVMMLIRQAGMTTQRDLIRETGSDKAGMVRTVADLEELGYLSRTPSASDKRVGELTLTPHGIEIFDLARQYASGAAEGLFAPFTAEELETLEALLRRFVADPDDR